MHFPSCQSPSSIGADPVAGGGAGGGGGGPPPEFPVGVTGAVAVLPCAHNHEPSDFATYASPFELSKKWLKGTSGSVGTNPCGMKFTSFPGRF